MIPMKHSSIFRSRWMALLWAAGFIWMAVDVANNANEDSADNPDNNMSAAHQDGSGAPYTDKDIKELKDTLRSL
jgi:cytoskeletal protein RodZ